MTPNRQPDRVTDDDRYEMLFDINRDSVEAKIDTALFGLTTLVWDDGVHKAVVDNLNDAMVILRDLKVRWKD